MISLLNRPDRSGLVANVAGALAIVIVLNGLIFGLGWQGNAQLTPSFVPPPIVIGIVWIALFPCMALARWELNRAAAERSEQAGLIVLFALCALYPFYTVGLKSDLVGESANVTILLLAAGLAVRFARRIPRASAWLVPLVLWLSFASVAEAFTLASIGK
jgi:tryptophan-rich sensory protein